MNIKGGDYTAYNNVIIGGAAANNPGGVCPYQGTGRLNVSSGNFSLGWGGSFLYIGSGRTADTTGRRVMGIADISGGFVSIVLDSQTLVGYNGGKGSMVVRQADPNVATSVSSADAQLVVGGFGYSNALGYQERSQGTYLQTAGQTTFRGLMVGRSTPTACSS